MTNFLQNCRENKITLNPDKFQISRNVEFGVFQLESKIDESGNYKIHIYPLKIAINNVDKFPEPHTKKQLHQFLCLINVFKSWSRKSENMREALKKGRDYKFNKDIKKEFEDIKKEISDAASWNHMIRRKRSILR